MKDFSCQNVDFAKSDITDGQKSDRILGYYGLTLQHICYSAHGLSSHFFREKKSTVIIYQRSMEEVKIDLTSYLNLIEETDCFGDKHRNRFVTYCDMLQLNFFIEFCYSITIQPSYCDICNFCNTNCLTFNNLLVDTNFLFFELVQQFSKSISTA